MLKRRAVRKIFITTFVLFILLTIYFIPSGKKDDYSNIIYRYHDTEEISVYLLNENSQLTKVQFQTGGSSFSDTIFSIIRKLTISNDATIPNGFEQVIPKGTKLLGVTFDEKIVSLNFSKEFLEISTDEIEYVIESIVYSIFDLNNVSGVSIYVEGENISKLFAKDIPNIITKEYGINKRVELRNFFDVSRIVIYYIDTIDHHTYYVPITKYVNDKRDKIKIIIDELSSNYIYESNLITLLDKNIKLMDYQVSNDAMILNFNNSIFLEQDHILEEVVYSISYSVFANYDVNQVIFQVDGKEVTTMALS